MDQMMKKIMAKKKDEDMDENYKSAKMSMLKALREEMGKLMGEDLKTAKLKKVEVLSNDKEGLEKGLEKAKDVVEDMPEEANGDKAMASILGENKEEADEEDEYAGMDADKLEAMIAKLQAMKAKC